MRILVVGGNLGHTSAAVLSNRESVIVDLLTHNPEKWNKEYVVNLPSGERITGKLNMISCKPEALVPNADWIFLCLPATQVEKELLRIKPYLTPETIVGSVVGNTGFFIYCHKHLNVNSKLFSFQRVPYISRIVEYGKEANLLGYRDRLIMAVENIEDRESFRRQVEYLFGEETVLADSFYEVTLSNSNPILHTGRVYTMWKDWDGKPYDRCSLFYKEWTKEASELEIEMDKEFFALLKELNVSTAHIETLLNHYESTDADGMTNKIRSIESLSTILSPMKHVVGGWVPDCDSRYFTEDFPFGLRFIYNQCCKYGVICPSIEKVYKWGLSFGRSYSEQN